jgi:DNA-binding CsgD family transcriptional regulator
VSAWSVTAGNRYDRTAGRKLVSLIRTLCRAFGETDVNARCEGAVTRSGYDLAMSPEGTGGLGSVVERLGGDLGAAIETLGFPMYVLDAAGIVRWLNDAAAGIVGDVVGVRYGDLVAPEAAPKAQREFTAKVLGTRRRSDYELVALDREGRRFRIQVTAVPLVDGGRVVGILGVGHPTGAVAGDPAGERLTPRQREVLALLTAGKSTAEIAAELALSQETVRNHVRQVLRRLGVRSRLEAVLEARRLGLAGDARGG